MAAAVRETENDFTAKQKRVQYLTVNILHSKQFHTSSHTVLRRTSWIPLVGAPVRYPSATRNVLHLTRPHSVPYLARQVGLPPLSLPSHPYSLNCNVFDAADHYPSPTTTICDCDCLIA